jgi:long-chain acyl-CoA synthetase
LDPKSRLIHAFLEKTAELFPEKTAVIYEHRRARYGELDRWANSLAHGLIGAGVEPGDRVVLLCENGIAYVVGYYGTLKAGGIVASLNTDLKPDGLAELVKELEPKALVVSAKHGKTVRKLDASMPGPIRIIEIGPRRTETKEEDADAYLPGDIAALSASKPAIEIDPKTCATIVYTSGSAGKPKGVMLSHANVVANTRSIVEYLGLTSDDVQMVVLPFFYVMGKSLLNTHVAVGGTVVVNNRFAYTAAVLKQMAVERVTGFSGVPSTYAHLLFKSPLASYRDKLPALRYCSQAGGHMARHVKQELLKVLPKNTKLIVMYGATEASARLTYLPPERLRSKIDSIGIPIPGVTMKVLSPEGMPLRPGETGELVAKGENIMLGYYRDSEATRKVLDNDSYHTGDLGYADDEGFFYVTGRKDEQLKIGGHRLNPMEIEDAIIESGGAAECIVFATKDDIMGQKLAGLIVPIDKTPDMPRIILEYLHLKLPKYKVPASLAAVGTIPKNSSGKPDRVRSVELYERVAARKAENRA